MALDSTLKYIGHFVFRQLGIGTFAGISTAANSTQLRVLNPEMFGPAGGQVIDEENDNLITYTAIQDDILTGVPSTGTGSIANTIKPFDNAAPSLLYVPELATSAEIEAALKRFRRRLIVECLPDPDKKIYRAKYGWLGTGLELRDDKDAGFNTVSPNSTDEEAGEFTFSSAQAYEVLYCAGYVYDPYVSIAAVYESLILNERWSRYVAAGQLVKSGIDSNQISNIYRERTQFKD